MRGEAETLERLAGELIIGGFDGPPVPEDFADLVARGAVGGVILFKRNFATPADAARLLAELQARAPAPLWTAVDQEGGRVQRLGPPFPQLPPMREIGARGDPASAREAGGLLARHLLPLGFRQDYAPVLDVDTNPRNPVIGDRSFSRDPEEVGRFGAALIAGLEESGVAACGKHFPGHGDTSQDSHLELPRLDHDLARLQAVELVPFRAAVRAGVASIMTAHVLFPALDAEHPATLSEKILSPLLRDALGYRGVVVSDDLEMKAVADHYGVEDAAVRAIRVGCDQLLICSKPSLQAAAHAALVRAVERGQLDRARLTEAATRVRAMKARFPLAAAPIVA
ncbi:MAG: beta-N-acetylhexosaminidase [Deltaproteobacteria bacterium]|nr:beta-N-acetylhexosaminidase [Deltaproteobacteria bacterium]